MKTLVIDAHISSGAFVVREFDGATAQPISSYQDMGDACAYAQIWSDQLVAQCEPCSVVYINPKGESQQLQTYSRTVAVPINGCTALTTAQLEHLAEEFFGRVHDGEVHFAQKKFAEAFADTLGVPMP